MSLLPKDPTYHRVPGKGTDFTGVSTLWLGEDHLLVVEVSGFTERYKRFSYRDIQAIVLRPTVTGRAINVVLGVLAALCLLFAANTSDAVIITVLAGTAGLFGLGIVINTTKGPTCACQLRTAVKAEPLKALGRLATARQGIALIRERVEGAQGTVTAEDIAAAQNLPPVAEAPRPQPVAAAPRLPDHYHGRFHALLFYTLLGDAALAATHLVHQARWMLVVNGLITMAEIFFLVGSLVKQQDSDVPRPLRRVVWWTLGGYGALFLISIAYSMYISATRPGIELQDLSPWDDAGLLALMIASMVTCA
ncbi:MAG: hypothetical protein AB1705_06935, partial [Verrucomicrobiota bacterium]